MPAPDPSRLNRRQFIQRTGLAVGAAGAGLTPAALAAGAPGQVYIIREPGDPVAGAAAAQWAAGQLKEQLRQRGLETRGADRIEESRGPAIITAGSQSPPARRWSEQSAIKAPSGPEAFALIPAKSGSQPVVLVCGSDTGGLVYGLLELAERVRYAGRPIEALEVRDPVQERPANRIRSVSRLFVSEVEDKPWFYDRAFWQSYLTLLASERFNRFNLAFGLGYDFTWDVRDAYFHFAYPFLVLPAGYNVRAAPLPDEERERNLDMLRFISREATTRGLQFQLGLWTHAYDWSASPHANYRIQGLTPATHAPYCRDALSRLLSDCPDIGGVTLRTHGESGVPEGSYDFWKTVLEGITRSGRKVEIDLHAKGIDQRTIDLALATGMPVTVSPKFWAEHMGLPYMQCAIRPQELPPPNAKDTGFFGKSTGSRRFLRYGYGDLMREDRRYGVLHRIWPGTQRLLLWGSPAQARGYGRASSFCGSLGAEILEPLSFKGRKGSGLPGGRNAYADDSLKPVGGDFEKFRYTYSVWGRCLYNPDTDPAGWQRLLRAQFGGASSHVELSLAAATTLLPLVTTAHCPSAANNNYWPELYSNMSIVDPNLPLPFDDTPTPRRFGTVSPLDPELFSRMDDFADELLAGGPGPKYSPVWVADHLVQLGRQAQEQLSYAHARIDDPLNPEFRRFAADVAIQAGLGSFFADKFRAGVLYALYLRTGDTTALTQAISNYRGARDRWASLANGPGKVYVADITFGWDKHLRGHWLDRLQAIEEDIARMEKILASTPGQKRPVMPVDRERAARALHVINSPSLTPRALGHFHDPPPSFQRGRVVPILVSLGPGAPKPHLRSLALRYRRVNQADPWQSADMQKEAGGYRGLIPAEATDSPFPLQYYFLVTSADGGAWPYPGLDLDHPAQPFYVLRQTV
jgi:hypothetical protein